MTPTMYFEDFLAYYEKAHRLQEMNISSPTGRDLATQQVGDPLMDWIPIYDTVERRYAGFSNALQQVWFGSANPKRWQALPEFDGARAALTELDWMFVFLIHRITGSGASFSHDHGFRNSIVADMVRNGPQAGDMKRYVLSEMRAGRPIFTSIGNQIPAFMQPTPVQVAYKRPSELYIDQAAPRLVHETLRWLQAQPKPVGIKEAVEKACEIQSACGQRKFHFVLTAWVMDLGEMMPHYVDPHSHVGYGKNALEAFALMFDGFKQRHAEAAMDYLIGALEERGYARGALRPYSLEDVACDTVRYVEHYVPKGFELLHPLQVMNAALVRHRERHRTFHAHLARWGATWVEEAHDIFIHDAERYHRATALHAEGNHQQLQRVLEL